jgi:hypothetical protein
MKKTIILYCMEYGTKREMTDSRLSSFGGPCEHRKKLYGSIHAVEYFLSGALLGISTGFTSFLIIN